MSLSSHDNTLVRHMAGLATQCDRLAREIPEEAQKAEITGPASSGAARDLKLIAAGWRMVLGWCCHWPEPDPRLLGEAQTQLGNGSTVITSLEKELSVSRSKGKSKGLLRRFATPRPLEERLEEHQAQLQSHQASLRHLLESIETSTCGHVRPAGQETQHLGSNSAPSGSENTPPASNDREKKDATSRRLSTTGQSDRTLVSHSSPKGQSVADGNDHASMLTLSQLELRDPVSHHESILRGSEGGTHHGDSTEDIASSESSALSAIVARGQNSWPLDLALQAGRTDILTTLLAGLPPQSNGPRSPMTPRTAREAEATPQPPEPKSPGAKNKAQDTAGLDDTSTLDLSNPQFSPSVDARLDWRRDTLLAACRRGDRATAQLLLDLGAPASTREPPATIFLTGRTALHVAARHGHADLARLLLARGARADALYTGNRHPLHEAAAGAHAAVARLLLEHGAAADPRDEAGYRPLHVACMAGAREVAECLLDAGAAIDAAGNDRFQPIHHAAQDGGSAGLIRVLVARGADVNAVHSLHGSPLAMARRAGREEVVGALREAGAEEAPVQGAVAKEESDEE